MDRGERASRSGGGTSCRQRCGSGIAKGRARYGAPGSQSFDRQASRREKGQEVTGWILGRTEKEDQHGTEDTPVRISPRLQKAVEAALARRPRLRGLAARRCEAA